MSTDRITVPQVRSHKASESVVPLVTVTAYDAPGARMADAAGVDIILVGDSLAMVVLGYEDTLSVTIENMSYHTLAVARAKPKALIVADMPWMSYHTGANDAVKNASQLIRSGADAVKLEGGSSRLSVMRALIDAEIPVMGHLGLTPQSVHAFGGYSVQAKTSDAARKLIDDALAIEDAGVFSLVLEAVPEIVAEQATKILKIPIIGIGAGAACDGQVLVFHDLLGLSFGHKPKFVRQYGSLGESGIKALEEFARDVRMRNFPSADEGYQGNRDDLADFKY